MQTASPARFRAAAAGTRWMERRQTQPEIATPHPRRGAGKSTRSRPIRRSTRIRAALRAAPRRNSPPPQRGGLDVCMQAGHAHQRGQLCRMQFAPGLLRRPSTARTRSSSARATPGAPIPPRRPARSPSTRSHRTRRVRALVKDQPLKNPDHLATVHQRHPLICLSRSFSRSAAVNLPNSRSSSLSPPHDGQ